MNATPTPAERIRSSIPVFVAPGDIDDPIDQVRAYEAALEAVKDLQSALAGSRARAVKEARQTRTIAVLATELGVTPARVYQIMNGVPD